MQEEHRLRIAPSRRWEIEKRSTGISLRRENRYFSFALGERKVMASFDLIFFIRATESIHSRSMLLSRWFVFIALLLVLLLLSETSDGQQEFRQAFRAKKNRKVQQGKKKIEGAQQRLEDGKNVIKQPIQRVTGKVTQKIKKSKKKIQAIEQIIKS